jgi:hypothetical protein
MNYELTYEDVQCLRRLTAAGCAVCVFLPQEMVFADPERVNDAMAEAGHRQIDFDNQGETK